MDSLFKKLIPKNPWHFVWIIVIVTNVFTFILNSIQSLIWYGRVVSDLIIIGTIDAIIVSLLVGPPVIYFVIEHRKKIEQKLLALSLTDELTGLNNRRGFFMLAEHQMKIAHRSRIGMFLLYADIDHFKQLNDRFGHQDGDRVLREVAHFLKSHYRETDIIARMGGDEFVIFPAGTSQESVHIIAERFQQIVGHFKAMGMGEYQFSISFGTSFYDPSNPCTLDELLRQADTVMYQNKNQKRLQA